MRMFSRRALAAAALLFFGNRAFGQRYLKSKLPYLCDLTLWDDARAPVYSLLLGSAAPDVITFGGSGNIKGYGFAAGESMMGTIQLSHAYKEGTDAEPHVHWAPTTTDNGNIKWGLEYYWLNAAGDSAAGAPTTITAEVAASGTAWRPTITGFPTISGAGKTISSQFVFRIYRDNASSDEFTGDGALMEVDIHNRLDSMGSYGETSK